MVKLATQLSEYITHHMKYDDDKKSVITYGLIALFQMLTIAIIISLIGIFADFWYETIIIFLGVGFLRKSTGGVHAQTMLGCTIISIVSISALSAFCRYVFLNFNHLYISLVIFVLLILICFFIAYRKVPVDTPNKPIKKAEKIKRLRRQSFITISIYSILIILFLFLSVNFSRYLSISCSILLALLWQTLTLTKTGAVFINSLDSLFKKAN